MYNGHKRYNKSVEPPSVPLSYLLYMRYARVHQGNSWGTKGVHWGQIDTLRIDRYTWLRKGCTQGTFQVVQVLEVWGTIRVLGVHEVQAVQGYKCYKRYKKGTRGTGYNMNIHQGYMRYKQNIVPFLYLTCTPIPHVMLVPRLKRARGTTKVLKCTFNIIVW